MKQGIKQEDTKLVASLDIGSSKICCLIAEVLEDEESQAGTTQAATPPMAKVLGIGHHLSRGVKNGTIVNLEDVTACVQSALTSAEIMADVTIDHVVVNLSGGDPLSRVNRVEIPISGKEITDVELRKALIQSYQLEDILGQSEDGRQLVHSIPVSYSIDGTSGIRDPRGMFGEKFGIDLLSVSAAKGPMRNLTKTLERCQLGVAGIVLSPYACGLSALIEDEKQLGVTLIDMGAGTTSLAVFYEGSVVFTDIIPVGGHHVTHDIARGLSTPIREAERLKTLYGYAVATGSDKREMINVPQIGESDEANIQQVARSLLVDIIQPRLEETFELVRARLDASGLNKLAGRRVVLTGGAAQLAGIRDLAALTLDKQVRIGRPVNLHGLAEATAGPAFATAAGLTAYAMQAQPFSFTALEQPSNGWTAALGRARQWLQSYL